MMTERVSITNMKPMRGSTATESVIMAITPSVAPRDMAPVSPMMKCAGKMLYQTNPSNAPTNTAQRAARMKRPLAKAKMLNAPKAIIKRPPASPSRPSVMFTAFEVAVITKMKSGM